MTPRYSRTAGLTAATLVFTLTGAGAGRAQTPFSTATYGQAEAARGQGAYVENCSRCHGADMAAGEFGPALKGPVFASHWVGIAK